MEPMNDEILKDLLDKQSVNAEVIGRLSSQQDIQGKELGLLRDKSHKYGNRLNEHYVAIEDLKKRQEKNSDDISGLKGTVIEHNGELKAVKVDTHSIRGDVKDIKETLETTVEKIEGRLEGLSKKVWKMSLLLGAVILMSGELGQKLLQLLKVIN